jgi:hypothetical protein
VIFTLMFDAFLPSHSSILDRQNKPWSFVNIGRPMDPTRLSDPTVLTRIGRQKLELALMTKESLEPLSVRRLMSKVASWIL